MRAGEGEEEASAPPAAACGGAMPPRAPGTSSRTIPPPNGSPKLVQLFQLPAQLRVAPEENVFRRAAVTGLRSKRWVELGGAP